MRADNNGEGGMLALMALALRTLRATSRACAGVLMMLGIFGAVHVLRRRGDHARDLGDLGGRGPGDRRAVS